MIKKIDHIGIAVADMQQSVKIYESLTGQPVAEKESVPEQAVETAFFPVGDVRLELLKGTQPDSPISKFIAKRGPGIHHICFEVQDLERAKSTFAAAGLEFIENVSDRGAGGSRVAFIHPESTGGLLIELVEYPQ